MAQKPLITLNSNLRNVSFSDTEKPYVTKPVPGYNQKGFSKNELNSRVDDLTRITKLLLDKPGRKFYNNQVLLQSQQQEGTLLARLAGSLLQPVKIIASIVAQVPVNGTGTHFVNGFGGFEYLKQGGPGTTVLGRFLRENLGIGNNGINGAAAALRGQTIIPDNDGQSTFSTLAETKLTDQNTKLGLEQNNVDNEKYILSSFPNVPGVGGVASLIPKLTPKTGAISKDLFQSDGYSENYINTVQESLPKPYNIRSNPWKTSNIQIENKLYQEDTSIDEIGKSTSTLLGTAQEDIIPFEFNIITPTSEWFLYFRAFLDDLSDSFTGNWNSTNYIGRAEEFYTYQGFKRSIQFSFKIAAFSRKKLEPLYEKLNLLVASTAPTYDGSSQFMRGTLCKLTIGDYLSNQDGFISNVDIKWNNTYQWEMDVDDEGLERVPHVLDISVSFVPIHNFNVKSNINGTSEKYIGKRTLPPPPPPAAPKDAPQTENLFFNGTTVTVDKVTRKVQALNGQPVTYKNGGFVYNATGQYDKTRTAAVEVQTLGRNLSGN